MPTFPTLGLIAGKGELPRLVAASRACFIFGFEGLEPDKVTPHAVTQIARVGDTLAALKQAGVSELVFAGHMKRPSLLSLKPDAEGARLLAKLGKAMFKGDDALLTILISYVEEQGFKVLGAEEVVGKELLAPPGPLTTRTPNETEMASIRVGLEAAKALGGKDIGQAVVVLGERVITKEDQAGTDAMLTRLGPTQGAILVKASKPNQERRVDLPTIGLNTVEIITSLGFSGIALEAEKTLILEKEQAIAAADKNGVFIYGITHTAER